MSKSSGTAKKKEKPESYTIPIILELLDIPADAALARRLGYKGPWFVNKWKNEEGVTIPRIKNSF
jgi:hypothetical protein